MILSCLSQLGFVDSLGRLMKLIFAWKVPSTLRTDCSGWWIRPWLFSFFLMSSFFIPRVRLIVSIRRCLWQRISRDSCPLYWIPSCWCRCYISSFFFSFRTIPWITSFYPVFSDFLLWAGTKRFSLVGGCHPFAPDVHSIEIDFFFFLWRRFQMLVTLVHSSNLTFVLPDWSSRCFEDNANEILSRNFR